MNTLLFDIDGTLIRTAGAGFHAMRLAMKSLFNIEEFSEVPVHGRTDHGILTDIFQLTDLDLNKQLQDFSERYWQHLPDSLHETPGEVLPGVLKLLNDLSRLPDFALGILTGNAHRAAEIKLQHFQLESFFHFGGFGDHHTCRDEVARLAFESAQQFLGNRFDSQKIWVIGDTVNDIACARAIGSKVAVVETGGATAGELKSAKPDAQFRTLEGDGFMNLFQ